MDIHKIKQTAYEAGLQLINEKPKPSKEDFAKIFAEIATKAIEEYHNQLNKN